MDHAGHDALELVDWQSELVKHVLLLQRKWGSHIKVRCFVPHTVLRLLFNARETDRRYTTRPVGTGAFMNFYCGASVVPVVSEDHLDFVRYDCDW